MMRKLQRYLKQSRYGTKTMRNFLLDMRYGAFLGGVIKSRHKDQGAHDTANTDYDVMPQIFDGQIKSCDVIVDVGCGKGRVINWWLRQGIKNRIIGLELDQYIAEATKKRLENYKNVQIIAGDAIDNFPEEGTLFYLFNPFDISIMEKFKQRLEDMSDENRNLTIIYYKPKYIDLFKGNSRWQVEEFKIKGVDRSGRDRCAIIRMAPRR